MKMKLMGREYSIQKKKNQTLTPPGKQKEAKSFKRIASFFPGGYLKSICGSEKEKSENWYIFSQQNEDRR